MRPWVHAKRGIKTALTNDGQLNDEALIQHAAEGDDHAFAMLVKRHELRLYNYIRRIASNPAMAEDLFQEVFMSIHDGLATFQAGTSFRVRLYQAATNRCCEVKRARGKRRAAQGETEPAIPAFPARESTAGEDDLVYWIEAAVARLPVNERIVLLLAKYASFSHNDIAHVLEVPASTVKSRLSAAVEGVIGALAEDAP